MKRYFLACAFMASASIFSSAVIGADQHDAVRGVDPVAWPADMEAAAPIPGGPLAEARKSYLPVLLPPRFAAYRSLVLVAKPLTYSASVHGDRYRASITGTRISFGAAGAGPVADLAIEGGIGEQSSYATFVRYGVGYRVDVECDLSDASACATPAIAEDLARSVELFGGRKGDPGLSDLEVASAPLPTPLPADPNFTYEPAGKLRDSGATGVTAETVHAPGIRFPVEMRNAYLNSQVYGIGGGMGPDGSWRDKRNHAYPWRDTFCEARARATPACPSGKGHQGVDIRADQPEPGRARRYWAVAAEDGTILSVGSYSVVLLGTSGMQYRYLHMQNPVAVRPGQDVGRGQRMGLISNSFGGAPTTIHLHFEILRNERGQGFRHVAPYMSLVKAYKSFG